MAIDPLDRLLYRDAVSKAFLSNISKPMLRHILEPTLQIDRPASE
jgi:hypothetical protein